MGPDPRWREVWAEVRPSTKHADWVDFYLEIAPGSLSEGTSIHRGDIESNSRVFGEVLTQMIRDLDARLDGGEGASGEPDGPDWYISLR